MDNATAAVKDADALVLLTEWQEFRNPVWSEIKEQLRGTQVYDGRNIFSPAEVSSAGLSYSGIGRGVI